MNKNINEIDLSTIGVCEFLKYINNDDCYWCQHFNGECIDFAKEGTCRAFNIAKEREKK